MSTQNHEAGADAEVNLDTALIGGYAGAEAWYLEYRDIRRFDTDCSQPVDDESALRDMLPTVGEQMAVRAFEQPHSKRTIEVSGSAAISELISL